MKHAEARLCLAENLVFATEMVSELVATLGAGVIDGGEVTRLLEVNRVLWEMRWDLKVLPSDVTVNGSDEVESATEDGAS